MKTPEVTRRKHGDTSLEFRGTKDERRCLHCYVGRRHSVDAHVAAVGYYKDDGTRCKDGPQ